MRTISTGCRLCARASTANSHRSWQASAPGSASPTPSSPGRASRRPLDTIRLLRTRRLLETAIGVAPCLDGDVQAVSTASALTWAKAEGFDLVVCGIGPGIVGTGSVFGHGGLAVAEAANAAAALGGRAVVTVRYSSADLRDRHRGVSHHTRSALRLVLGAHDVAWPCGLPADGTIGSLVEVPVDDLLEASSNLPLSHMGRGPAEDPWFFAAAFAAGRHARSLLE